MLTVNPNTHLVRIDRGDDQPIRVTVTDAAGAIVNVSAGTFKFTVKASLEDAVFVLQKSSPAGSGIDLALAASGVVDVLLVPSDTLSLAGVYVWDLEMVLASKTRTLAKGIFVVEKEVTTPGTIPPPAVVPINYLITGFLALDGALYLLGDEVPKLYHKFLVVGGVLTDAGTGSSVPF